MRFFLKVWDSELSESTFDIFKIFFPSKGYYMLAYSGMILNFFSIFYMLHLGTCLLLTNNDSRFYSCDLFNFDNRQTILSYKKKIPLLDCYL